MQTEAKPSKATPVPEHMRDHFGLTGRRLERHKQRVAAILAAYPHLLQRVRSIGQEIT